MTTKNQTVEEFLNQVADKNPTPGGGAVAAVTGALAASLVEMVCNLTIDKKGYEDVGPRVKDISQKVMEIRLELMDLADADSEAFQKVMEAYKTKDNAKIKAALYWAIEIPDKTKQLSEEIQEMALEIAKIGNKSAYSDAVSAESLANAAIEATGENIEINKKMLAKLQG